MNSHGVYAIMTTHLILLVIHYSKPFYNYNNVKEAPISQIRATLFTDFMAFN